MRYNQFYSELGKLLYAIADADGNISDKEKTAVKELVKKELVPLEHSMDEFGTDAGYYTEFEFDIMDESVTDPGVAFESFLNYVDDHKTAIDAAMIEKARKLATQVAEAHHHTNKKERQLLEKLNKKLGEIQKK